MLVDVSSSVDGGCTLIHYKLWWLLALDPLSWSTAGVIAPYCKAHVKPQVHPGGHGVDRAGGTARPRAWRCVALRGAVRRTEAVGGRGGLSGPWRPWSAP
ncbi:hypothetical protein ONE63_008171 [Megalurothrips usitatus]|uniref:Uncharacterized protein n=1 Tax=Megalurothrips usitatus TaxID=439358 RepID=A0AAV7XKC0_9NEOP|nr:hypothetical protein ONE63_008171 [Megalurothrips usitatus]